MLKAYVLEEAPLALGPRWGRNKCAVYATIAEYIQRMTDKIQPISAATRRWMEKVMFFIRAQKIGAVGMGTHDIDDIPDHDAFTASSKYEKSAGCLKCCIHRIVWVQRATQHLAFYFIIMSRP